MRNVAYRDNNFLKSLITEFCKKKENVMAKKGGGKIKIIDKSVEWFKV